MQRLCGHTVRVGKDRYSMVIKNTKQISDSFRENIEYMDRTLPIGKSFDLIRREIEIGIPTSLGFGALDFIKPLGMSILDAMDFISNSVLMPIVAVLTCVFVGFVIKPQAIIDEVEASDNGAFKSKKMFTVMIKWIAPIFLIAILISSILNAFGIITM